MTPWTATCQASLSFTISQSLLKLMSIESMNPSNHLIFCPPFLPAFNLDELALHIRCPKYWSFRFSITTSSEYSGLISFMIDWFDLLEVPGTLKSPLQHHISITADDDCSHEIKRHLLLGRKAMTNLNSILKIRGITVLSFLYGPTHIHT